LILPATLSLKSNYITIHNQTNWFGGKESMIQVVGKMKSSREGKMRWREEEDLKHKYIKSGASDKFEWKVEEGLRGEGADLASIFIIFCLDQQECLKGHTVGGPLVGTGKTKTKYWSVVAAWRSDKDKDVKDKTQSDDGKINQKYHFFVCGKETEKNPAKNRRSKDSNWSHDGYIYQSSNETFTCPTD
jgi:hypothetical protein